MQIETVTNAQYANAGNTAINCMVKLVGRAESLPFTASGSDTELHGRQLFTALVRGDYGPVAAYVAPPPPTQAELDAIARKEAVITEADTDAFIEKLKNATPDQIKTWVQSNVTDLASARQVIGRLAVAVAYCLINK